MKEAASVNIITTIAKLVPLLVAVVAIIFSMNFDPAIFVDNFWGEPTDRFCGIRWLPRWV